MSSFLGRQFYRSTLYTSCVFTPASLQRAGYDKRQILKRSTTDQNSDFSFSLTNCRIKAKMPSLPWLLHIAERGRDRFMSFPKTCTQKWNFQHRPRFGVESLGLFPKTISATPHIYWGNLFTVWMIIFSLHVGSLVVTTTAGALIYFPLLVEPPTIARHFGVTKWSSWCLFYYLFSDAIITFTTTKECR